ncbi:hypothetical protein Poly24_32520 [Rosistilla carotiformis]|uniref:Glycosyl transferases group 1 n=1 Tax=Rosistilla carotiformis TaxID=2528017 RepID=A0A518JVI4_9BACT|nr:glycosyltransferase family 4 protein [Rosistilla carotiformis]QDV69536.1 hypothetical protein Poly24_32520 [Rosistilla carotiformis]
MRILVANIPLPTNRFLIDLNQSIGRRHEVIHDHESFWNQEGDFDLVHLHFPEYMTFEIQDAYRGALTDDLLAETEKRLLFWAHTAKIVVTRHVLLPHSASSQSLWESMYELVYRYADAVVHFAPPSIEEFKSRYSNVDFHHGAPRHYIVPHQNYASLPNDVSRAEARKRLRIPKDANVMLAFGAIRNDAERELVLDTFHRMRSPHKVLLVSRWREKLADVSWIRLRDWIRDLKRLYYRIHPAYRFNYGFVEEDDTQLYLNAADVLFIPRFHVLNSGNVTLGMTFGKVVVGPDSWDVGHLLRERGNVVFDPDHPETAASAMEHAMNLAAEGRVGSANRQIALDEWDIEQCGDRYSNIFEELVSARTRR